MINGVARDVMDYYPLPNTTADLNSNQILDDYQQFREVRVDRDNYDLKMSWQRNNSHSIWGKFATLDADVVDNFSLGFDEGSLGHTRVYVWTVGHTWTLGRNMVLDGNFGANIQNQVVTGPDFGEDLGLQLGIPGTNGTQHRAERPAVLRDGAAGATGYNIGTTPNWMPLYRHERSYTFSTALTKVYQHHDVRVGVDVVRHQLNHIQAEFGDIGGVRGGFRFNGTVTGVPGYTPLLWNEFGTFLLGQQTYQGKDVQTEEMIGREWQSAIYVRDRWNVSSNFTVSAGLRVENYPLMNRDTRGIERLDLTTYEALIGGLGNTPEDVGIHLKKWYVAPRLGAMYRFGEKGVARVGYGRTINPLPWSRPMRGSFPQDIFYNRTADQFASIGTLEQGIPPVPIPDISSGRVPLPRGVFMRSPNPNQVDRGVIQQWNVAYEHRLPWDIAAEVAYVGTRTDGGYADLDLNYGVPGGGNASRQYFALAGTTAINDWASRTKSRYHALQIAVNRPLKHNLLLKGAYTYSQAKNMADEDGWVGLTWNSPLMYDQNFALAGFDRPHVFQLGFVYTLPFMENGTSLAARLAQGWQVNGVIGAYSGTPFTVIGHQHRAQLPGLRLDHRQLRRRRRADGGGGCQRAALLHGRELLPADHRRRRRLRHDRPQLLPPAGRLERRPVGVQGVPDWPLAPGVPARDGQRVQPHDLGPPGRDLHGEQLHAVHAAEHGRHGRQQPAEHARVRAASRSGCARRSEVPPASDRAAAISCRGGPGNNGPCSGPHSGSTVAAARAARRERRRPGTTARRPRPARLRDALRRVSRQRRPRRRHRAVDRLPPAAAQGRRPDRAAA